ncbi:hypothetical protein N752_04980 [Desulforamulus aquiferis]|nr:PRC-barrel domain-containing protein [Desulforamulus aquiferis]RYD06247.1 hypothetical protein N752_04980 [Desulforamulus aquiferis]
MVDPIQQKVAALIIEQKGWFRDQKFAPYTKVRSVGNDAITLDQSSMVEKGASLPEILSLYKEKISIIGCRALAENGSQLGQVEEFFIEESSGSIVGLELSGNFINSLIMGKSFLDISFIKTLGKELVVTSNDAMDNMVKVDGGLQETVKQLKDSTSHIWENTVQKTKEFGTKTKELSSKTKDELENKSKELTVLTKDLSDSLTRQLDKVRGKKDPSETEDISSETQETARSFAPEEDRVQIADLPSDLQLTRNQEPEEVEKNLEEIANTDEPNQSQEKESDDLDRSFYPSEDSVDVANLPAEIQLTRNEAPEEKEEKEINENPDKK